MKKEYVFRLEYVTYPKILGMGWRQSHFKIEIFHKKGVKHASSKLDIGLQVHNF